MPRFALSVLIFLALTAVDTEAIIIDDLELIGKRGDTNNDQSINTTDIVYLVNYLYGGGPTPPCMNQADVNDDGTLNGSDPIFLSNWLFSGGSAPPAPGPYNPYCLGDTTPPNLGCDAYSCP